MTYYNRNILASSIICKNNTNTYNLRIGSNNGYSFPNIAGGTGQILTISNGNLIFSSPSGSTNVMINSIISDVKLSGTGGGTPGTPTTDWFERDINTIIGNGNYTSYISLNSNHITLQAGTYKIGITSMFHDSHQTKLRLKNITDTTFIYGISVFNQNTSTYPVTLNTIITIPSAKVYSLEYRTSVSNSNGLGIPSSFAGISEIYTDINISLIN